MTVEIRPCFGLEQECSLSLLDQRACRIRTPLVLTKFMVLAAERYQHLPARESSGIFLANGGRLYIDCGKPEITTPEVMTPADACRYSCAGEEILWDIANAVLPEIGGATQVVMTRSNISYGGSQSAWACHESYGHRCNSLKSQDFIPHAVSRIVFTGAGGFNNCTYGLQFLISPRVAHLHCSTSDNTQRRRGIFNTKDEPLCRGGYHRLHVICGESTASLLSQWLKMATTAVVVAMVEAGMSPGDDLQLMDPVSAMREFAQDVNLNASATLTNGKQITALEMQRRLLERARRLVVRGPINDWLPDCLRLWDEMLGRLQQGPAAVRRSLDWAIKWDLFRKHIERRGLSWEILQAWHPILERLEQVIGDEDCPQHLSRQEWARIMVRERNRLDPEQTVAWEDLELVLQLRQELFEIDTHFGELGPRGIFNGLDAQGLLDHDVPGVEDIRGAMTEPPSSGRAQLRGQVIKSMATQQIPGRVRMESHLGLSSLSGA